MIDCLILITLICAFLVVGFNTGDDVVSVKVKETPGSSSTELPAYATSGAACVDLCASLPSGTMMIKPGNTTKVPLGIILEIPAGYKGEIKPRSGKSLKGLFVIDGVVDSDYRGEVCAIVHNLSHGPIWVTDNERICQFNLVKLPKIKFESIEVLSHTQRGKRGFGSTGDQ